MVKLNRWIKNYKQSLTKYHFMNNQGSSIIMVLVAVAFVGILGSVILMLAFTNLQMKRTNLHAKETFYSAEKALDQIKSGLELKVSHAFSKAYTEVLQNYSIEVDNTRRTNFKANYRSNLEAELEYSSDRLYDSQMLYQYLDNDLKKYIELNEEFFIISNDEGVILQDIQITYTDEKDYTSIIQTDIKILIPPLKLFHNTEEGKNIEISDLLIYENWSRY